MRGLLTLLALSAQARDPRVVTVEVPADVELTPDGVKAIVRALAHIEGGADDDEMAQRRRADDATTEELAAWIGSGTDLSLDAWLDAIGTSGVGVLGVRIGARPMPFGSASIRHKDGSGSSRTLAQEQRCRTLVLVHDNANRRARAVDDAHEFVAHVRRARDGKVHVVDAHTAHR